MSRGSPMISFRIAPLLYERVRRRVAKRNARTKQRPWSMTDYWLQCVEQDLGKNERSAKSRIKLTSRPRKEVPNGAAEV